MKPGEVALVLNDAGVSAGSRITADADGGLSFGGIRIANPVRSVDPLDVEYDHVKLRDLLEVDFAVRTEGHRVAMMPLWWRIQDGLTPAQRAAVSAHWSAELRAKVKASREAERHVVRCDLLSGSPGFQQDCDLFPAECGSDPGGGGGGGGGGDPTGSMCQKSCSKDSDCSSWTSNCNSCVKEHDTDAKGVCADGVALTGGGA